MLRRCLVTSPDIVVLRTTGLVLLLTFVVLDLNGNRHPVAVLEMSGVKRGREDH